MGFCLLKRCRVGLSPWRTFTCLEEDTSGRTGDVLGPQSSTRTSPLSHVCQRFGEERCRPWEAVSLTGSSVVLFHFCDAVTVLRAWVTLKGRCVSRGWLLVPPSFLTGKIYVTVKVSIRSKIHPRGLTSLISTLLCSSVRSEPAPLSAPSFQTGFNFFSKYLTRH